MTTYNGRPVADSVLAEMRDWAMDCEWVDADDIPHMSDSEILRGIQHRYDGGVDGFLESIGADIDGAMREPRGRVQ